MVDELLATVVVPVKGDQRVYRLLDSLLRQTISKHSYEIIIVENGGTEFADVTRLCNFRVRYLNMEEANMAAARNKGLHSARGRYLLHTDADCVVQPDWIEQMTQKLEEGHYAVVGGQIRKFEPKTWTQRYSITIVDGQAKLNYLPALPLPYVAGANAGFLKSAILEVGGFDERFISGSDVDICYKLGLSGYHVGLAPKAIVLHEDRANVFAHFCRFKNYAIYQVLLFASYRHISGRQFIINIYPFKRVAQAILTTPSAAISLICGDVLPASRLLLQLVEAVGIWVGDIQGSIRFRQFYL